jgi:hypothetical protein
VVFVLVTYHFSYILPSCIRKLDSVFLPGNVFVKEMAKFVQPLIINETVIQDEAKTGIVL